MGTSICPFSSQLPKILKRKPRYKFLKGMVHLTQLLTSSRSSRIRDIATTNVFKVGGGWLLLIGVSVGIFTQIRSDAVKKRKDHIRKRKELEEKARAEATKE